MRAAPQLSISRALVGVLPLALAGVVALALPAGAAEPPTLCQDFPTTGAARGVGVKIQDVDGDGDQDLVLSTPMGASTDHVRVMSQPACGWEPFTIDGEELVIEVGGTVKSGAGARCTYRDGDNQMAIYRTERIGESDRHVVTWSTYTMTKDALTARSPEQQIQVTDDELAELFPATFDCEAGVSTGLPFPDGPTDSFDDGYDSPTTTTPSPKSAKPEPVKAKPRFTG